MAENGKRKKDSARLIWDSKLRRAPNPKDVEFQTVELWSFQTGNGTARKSPSFRDSLLGIEDLDKTQMNRLIRGDNSFRQWGRTISPSSSVDWDYDGATFRSQWQDLRGNGRKTPCAWWMSSATMQQRHAKWLYEDPVKNHRDQQW